MICEYCGQETESLKCSNCGAVNKAPTITDAVPTLNREYLIWAKQNGALFLKRSDQYLHEAGLVSWNKNASTLLSCTIVDRTVRTNCKGEYELWRTDRGHHLISKVFIRSKKGRLEERFWAKKKPIEWEREAPRITFIPWQEAIKYLRLWPPTQDGEAERERLVSVAIKAALDV